MPSEPKIAPNSPIWFFEEFRGFFSTKFSIFLPNVLYQPNEQLWGGGKCRFLNRPFIITPLCSFNFFRHHLTTFTHLWDSYHGINRDCVLCGCVCYVCQTSQFFPGQTKVGHIFQNFMRGAGTLGKCQIVISLNLTSPIQ